MIHFIDEGYLGSSYLCQFTFKSALLRGNINEIRRGGSRYCFLIWVAYEGSKNYSVHNLQNKNINPIRGVQLNLQSGIK